MSTPESMIEKLKTALNLVDVVKKENEVYKENFEKLSTNLKSIQDKNEKLIKEMTVNTNEKNQLEKDLEDYKDKSKKRLQEKDKEIHELLTNPPPLKEIELLKIQMKQDIEHSQKSKFDLIDRECSKFRNLYYKVRREMEATIIDSDSKVNELNRTMEIDQRHHQEELSNLKAQIVLLQQTADETSDIERLRITQREKQELELRVKSLLNELDQVRGEKEDLRILFEQEERNHKRQLADYISTSKSLHSEKDSLQSKCHTLEEELRVSQRKQDELTEEGSRYRKELDKTMNSLEEKTHQFKMEISDLKMQLLKEKSLATNEMEDYKTKMINLKNDCKNNKVTIQTLRDKISSLEKEYLDKVRMAREEEWAKISGLEAEKAHLEKELIASKQQQKDESNREDAIRIEGDKEIQRLKRELQEHHTLIEELQTLNQSLVLEKEHYVISLENSRKRIDEQANQIQNESNQFDSSKKQIQKLSEQVSANETTIITLKDQIDQLNEQLHREAEAYEHTMERQKMKFIQEKQMQLQHTETLNLDRRDLAEKVQMLESMIEKQQHIFESKITGLKDRVKTYKYETMEMKDALESENLKAKQKIQEMKKKQSGFLNFLQQVTPQ